MFVKMLSYGPFPEPRPAVLADDRAQLAGIAAAGFNAIRLYEEPGRALLDAAAEAGLWVFVGICWEYHCDFIARASLLDSARMVLQQGLHGWGGHPAVAGVLVANEIPADMVRWMGAERVRKALEELIDTGRDICPELLFAYASFPTTEYLEPDNADFTAMNVYLERREDFAAYLPRLHNVAGDRPVLLAEFGLDTLQHGMEAQRETLLWYVREALSAGMAGMTVYAWSDHWCRGGMQLASQWNFGLTDVHGKAKPALDGLSGLLADVHAPEDGILLSAYPLFSVVVCSYNGSSRIGQCLTALQDLDYPDYEVLVVDDGSTDNTAEVVKCFDGVRLVSSSHRGLSAARNLGAKQARGEIIAYTDDDCQPDKGWLKWLAHAYARGGWDACGGPNLPPRRARCCGEGEGGLDEVVVASAPGAPSHVLLKDDEAEHLPGCNLSVRKKVLDSIGGFDVTYRVAGDDVDFCWRLDEAGYRMGFSGAAFVRHQRRATLWGYFRQQYGYGKAEALLMRDHPEKFRRGCGALWRGSVYAGGAMTVGAGDVIYHGRMGTAPYQQIITSMQPERPMPLEWICLESRLKLALAKALQPRVRAWARWWHSLRWRGDLERAAIERQFLLIDSMRQYDEYEALWWLDGGVERGTVLGALLEDGWEALENDTDWDLMRDGLRLLVAVEVHAGGSMLLTRMEMDSRTHGQLPADFVSRLEGLGLERVR